MLRCSDMGEEWFPCGMWPHWVGPWCWMPLVWLNYVDSEGEGENGTANSEKAEGDKRGTAKQGAENPSGKGRGEGRWHVAAGSPSPPWGAMAAPTMTVILSNPFAVLM